MKTRFLMTTMMLLGVAGYSYAAVEQSEPKTEQIVTKPDIKAEVTAPAKKKINPGIPLDDPSVVDLVKTVQAYMQAWTKEDYTAMRKFEDFSEGKALSLHEYLRAYDPNFDIGEWRVTRVFNTTEEKGQDYRVLVWITHTPPARIAALLPEGKKVRSTLTQFWRKQDDQYVHLFHIEHKKLMNMQNSYANKPLIQRQDKNAVQIPLRPAEATKEKAKPAAPAPAKITTPSETKEETK